MTLVGFESVLGQELAPVASGHEIARARGFGIDAVDGAALREIALEMLRIDFDHTRGAARGELNHDPIVSGAAAASRLPAGTHVRRASWLQEIGHAAEVRVRAGERERTVLERRQIEE